MSFKAAGGSGPLAFVGLPFVLAAILDICTAQIAVPLAWRSLGFNPTWEQSGAPLEASQRVEHDLSSDRFRSICAGKRQQTSMEQRPMVRYYAARDAAERGVGGEPDMVQVYSQASARNAHVEQDDDGARTDAVATMVTYYCNRGTEPVLIKIYAQRPCSL